MYYTTTMSATFEAEKNRKAFIYTTTIVVAFILIAIFWTWIVPPPPTPIVQDLIEINLGNYDEGFGTVQPLIKGDKSPGDEPAEQQKQTPVAANNEPSPELQPDEKNDEDAAPVVKPDKPTPNTIVLPKQPTTQPVKNNTPTPAVVAEPKPQKPKIAGYSGPKSGTGNGATEDNGYKYEGNKPGGKGDAGDPSGKPDSYGNNPGGRTGGRLQVSKGDRKIVNNYIFMGELPKATIFAKIKVNPEGRGTFIGFDKGSSFTDSRYADAIRSYLPNIQFSKADHESTVTVPFNFRVQ